MSGTRSGPVRPGMRATAVAAALCLATMPGTSAVAADGDGAARPAGSGELASSGADRAGAEITSRFFADARGTETVFVELSGVAAYDAWRESRTASEGRSAAAATHDRVERDSATLLSAAQDVDDDAQLLYTTSNVIPGVAMRADVEALRALAEDERVVSIARLTPKSLNNTGAVLTTETLVQWQETGLLGDDVSIGIVDTGVDYTHAMFGGEGTVEAYEAAQADDTWTPTAKVVGGYDFAGDSYNANPTSDAYQPVPDPDADPLDCHGHGTHVAGSAAGYGVTADGDTYGPAAEAYTGLTEEALKELRMGPGTAPHADLYALRVFGCDGSTNLVPQALDWAVDPNGDFNFEDHLDIVNLSLGSDYGAEDDPENRFADDIATKGVLMVTSAGNAGDVTAVGGSPANSARSLAVANTVSGYLAMDKAVVTGPDDVAGEYIGQFSVEFDYEGFTLAPTPVVALATVNEANAEGCTPYSDEEKAAVAGKIVWLEWPIAFACGSAVRANNAQEAGAAGIVLSSEEPIFGAGISGNDGVPMFQFTAAGTDALRAAAEAGTLVVEFDGALRGISGDYAELEDLINPGTSRGSYGVMTIVKPDVAAPGTMIQSAGVGTGDQPATMSGTSMAAPHVAGIAALVREAQPDWTVEQVKADIMNTAGHDLFAGANQTPPAYGPNRVGSGRVDAQAAVTNDLLAYVGDGSGEVSVGFGVVEAPIDGGPVVMSKDVTVENTGDAAVTAAVAYSPAVEQPGVSYTVSPSSVSVAAGATATVTVTVTITPGQLRKTIDPTMRAIDETFGPIPRQFVSDASGRLLITPTDEAALRVPVHTAAKPVSTTTATFGVVGGQPSVVLHGAGVDQGTVGEDAYVSLASVHQLAGVSGRLPLCPAGVTDATDCLVNATAGGGDLRHIGVSSTVHETGTPEDAIVTFAVSTWQNWATPGAQVTPAVEIWTDPEREVPNFVLLAEPYVDTDLFFVDLYEIGEDGSASWVTDSPLNLEWGDIDTNLFDSNVALLGVSLGDLYPDGVPDDATIEFVVSTDSYYSAPGSDSSVVDAAPAEGRYSFDPVDPDLWAEVDGWPMVVDEGGVAIPVNRSDDAATDKLLVVHQHGPSGQRADVLTYRTEAQTDFAPAIEWMLENRVATGYSDGFRPATAVSRQAMAAFMYRFAHGGEDAPACTEQPFPDVSLGNQFCGAIEWLKEENLTQGYADGGFHPTAPMSRQAMAAFLERFAGDEGSVAGQCVAVSGFSDVGRGSEFCDEIRWLTAESGLASGYADGSFGPTRPVTRQAMASFLFRYAELMDV